MATEVQMPQITMTMLEGVIVEWHKKKGDAVTEGEPLVDIETDKLVQTLNASATGVLTQVSAEPGDLVPVGKTFCVIGEAGGRVSAPAEAPVPPKEGAQEACAAPVLVPRSAPEAEPAVMGAAEKTVAMPRLSAKMKDAVILRWLCQEGDCIAEDTPLFDAEVDDARRTVKAPEGGVVARLIAHTGETVVPGDLLYSVLAPAAAGAGDGHICATPAAKSMAAKVGLDLAKVEPTGPGGLIVQSDVKRTLMTPQKAVPAAAAQPAAEEEDELIPFVGIRRRIADNLMLTKKNAADVTTFAEVNMSRVRDFRVNLHISYNAFILKAAALALRDFPIMNASIADDKIVVKKAVNLCVAVATKRGLVTPVMRHAERMNLISVAEKLADYAERGRDGTLTAEDFEGGSFTVTNSGTYGALFFTPIINYPQSAILGVGKIMMTPIVQDGQIVPAPMMYACLSYDHRVVDGETAVKFLQKVKFYLENPDQMTKVGKNNG